MLCVHTRWQKSPGHATKVLHIYKNHIFEFLVSQNNNILFSSRTQIQVVFLPGILSKPPAQLASTFCYLPKRGPHRGPKWHLENRGWHLLHSNFTFGVNAHVIPASFPFPFPEIISLASGIWHLGFCLCVGHLCPPVKWRSITPKIFVGGPDP